MMKIQDINFSYDMTCPLMLCNVDVLLQTTYENFRYRYGGGQGNPFNKGVLGNFKEVFFSPIPPSRNNFRAKIPKEPQFPSRRMNGGFTDIEDGSLKEFVNVDREIYINDRTEHGGGSISESERVSKVNLPYKPQISHLMEDGIMTSRTSEALASTETEMNPTGDSAKEDSINSSGDSTNVRTTDGGFKNDRGLIVLHRSFEG